MANLTNKVKMVGGTNGTDIGNTGDRLNVQISGFDFPDNLPVTLPEYEDYLYRLRVTNPTSLFQGQWGFNGQPLLWSQDFIGGGQILEPPQTGNNFIKFTTTSASGDKAVYQTKRYFRYQPHRTHTLTFAAGFGPPTANVRKRGGQFDNSPTEGSNGFYVEMDGLNGITFVVASYASGSQTYTKKVRSQWNVDKLDGTGPSGITLSDAELGKMFIWNIDYSWYGASGVQFNIVIGPRRYVLHEETFSGVFDDIPFTSTAFLPLRLELENTGTVTGGASFPIGSISYDIENGDKEESGFQFSSGNGPSFETVGTGGTIIYALRPRLTVNGIENRGVLLPNNLEVISTADVYYEVLVGGQTVGGTFSPVVPTSSIAEESTTVTGYTGGRVVKAGYIASSGGRSSGSLLSSFPGDLFVSIDSLLGTQDALAIRLSRLGSSATAACAVGWREIY